MSFGYSALGFGAGNVYDLGMMTFNGTDAYYSANFTMPASNAVTAVGRFNSAQFSGGGGRRMMIAAGSSFICYVSSTASDNATVAIRNKLLVLVANSAATVICRLLSITNPFDSTDHSYFFSYNATAGTAVFYLDGVDADDTTNTSRVLTTGTIETGAGKLTTVGANNFGAELYAGQLGYMGFNAAYLTNPTDFYHPTNGLQQLDETGWTEWGGAQPLFWNQYGTMTDNKGSAGNMTANGTITGPA